MTEAEIAELFVKAAEVERKLPGVKGTRVDYGGYVLPWVHEVSDINMRRRTNDGTEKLIGADDPLNDWRFEWLDEWSKRPTNAQVSAWEACIRITCEFLTDAGQRRALWAWALSKADNLVVTKAGRSPRKVSFAKWCRDVESIAEMTGHRRKMRALAKIAQGVCGKRDLNDEIHRSPMLPSEPGNVHIFATIEGQRAVYDTRRVYSWRDDPAFSRPTVSLVEVRAAQRRQREARRRAA